MSSAGGGRDKKGDRGTDYLTPQFLIIIQKHDIEKISRRRCNGLEKLMDYRGEYDSTKDNCEIEVKPSNWFQ
jgi:hypothetical protein